VSQKVRDFGSLRVLSGWFLGRRWWTAESGSKVERIPSKQFPIQEQNRLQFRWELYNILNHTQFASVDTTARFNPATSELTYDIAWRRL
jgi:hypothetical protein